MDTTVYLRIPPPIQQIVTIGFYVGFKGCTHNWCKKAWLLNTWYLEPLPKWILQARTSTVIGFGSSSYEAQLLSASKCDVSISGLTAYTYLLAGLHRFYIDLPWFIYTYYTSQWFCWSTIAGNSSSLVWCKGSYWPGGWQDVGELARNLKWPTSYHML